MNIGADVVLPAQPQLADRAAKGNFVDTAIGIKGCRTHSSIFVVMSVELLTGGCAEASDELLSFFSSQLRFGVLAKVRVVTRRH